MKIKFYFPFFVVCALLLIACNGGSNKKDLAPAAEIKSIVDSSIKHNTDVKEQEITESPSVEKVASNVKAAGSDYELDLDDTSTYSVTCGKITPSWWSVKEDSCILYTPYVRIESESGLAISYSIRVNQSGNLETDDNAYVQYQVDDGEWITDTMLCGAGSPAVTTISGRLSMSYGHYVRFRVVSQTNDKTEFWAVDDGDIEISDGDETQTLISLWSGKPPTPPETNPYLPIELVSFTGKADDGSVILKWSTASEINNDYFVIEKSTDGEFFSEITRVDGAGNSNELVSYEYIDDKPSELSYYRLKQYDFDGATSCSDIIKVSLLESGKDEVQVSCRQGTVYIMTNSNAGGSMKVQIYNMSGAMVYESEFFVEKSSSTHTFVPAIPKNLIYIVSTTLNGQLPVNSKIYLD
jgi:hypothetical protein